MKITFPSPLKCLQLKIAQSKTVNSISFNWSEDTGNHMNIFCISQLLTSRLWLIKISLDEL